jgi:hypothetical protein
MLSETGISMPVHSSGTCSVHYTECLPSLCLTARIEIIRDRKEHATTKCRIYTSILKDTFSVPLVHDLLQTTVSLLRYLRYIGVKNPTVCTGCNALRRHKRLYTTLHSCSSAHWWYVAHQHGTISNSTAANGKTLQKHSGR